MKSFTLAAFAFLTALPFVASAQSSHAGLQKLPEALSVLPDGRFAAAPLQSRPGPVPDLKIASSGIRLISEYHAYGYGSAYRNNDSAHYVYSGSRDGYFDEPMRYDSAMRYSWDTGAKGWKPQSLGLQTFDGQDRVLTNTTMIWDAGNHVFRNSTQLTYAYDASGNQTLMMTQTWDPGANAWANVQRLTNYTYNFVDNVLGYTSQRWDPVNSSWEDGFRYSMSYNPNGRLLQRSVAEQWNSTGSSWDSVYKESYGYDGSGNNTDYMYQYWSAAGSIWKNSTANHYYYNTSGALIAASSQRGDGTGLSWLNNDSVSNSSLNAVGMPLTKLAFLAGSNVWNPSQRITLTYAPGGTLTATSLQEVWNGTAFVNSSRNFINYDATARITDSHSESFLSGLWVITGRDGNHRYHYADPTAVEGESVPRSALRLIPNPASDQLLVILPLFGAAPLDLKVRDIAGRQVMQQSIPAGTDRTTLATGTLADGVYVLQVFGGGQRWQSQFAVHH